MKGGPGPLPLLPGSATDYSWLLTVVRMHSHAVGCNSTVENLRINRMDTDLGDNSLLCTQEGVFRVNCMDCLDRTNVVQSVISQDILQTAVSDVQ